jgi:hypothetical protein
MVNEVQNHVVRAAQCATSTVKDRLTSRMHRRKIDAPQAHINHDDKID